MSARLLDGRNKRRGARRSRLVGAWPPVSEMKLAIVAAMQELGRAATSAEIYGMLDGTRSLSVIEYHLSTLVGAGVAELVFGPELHFRLTPQEEWPRIFRERCR